MTAPSTPGESRQRAWMPASQRWAIANEAEVRSLATSDPFRIVTLAFTAGQEEDRAALAKAEARIAELERERDAGEGSGRRIIANLLQRIAQQSARADAAEARIATMRAEALEEAAKIAQICGDMWRKDANETSDPGERRWNMMHGAERIEKQIRALIPASTSSCAAKDGEAGQ